MSVTPSSHVVGMFTERAVADGAVEELHNAGFENEHISYSTPGASGGFFEDLKSLFTGTTPGADNLIHDLTNMGLSNEQAQYYANEYNNGNTILVVNAPGREEQVLSILHAYGAYSAHSTGVQFNNAGSANAVPQAVDNVGLNDYASPETQSSAPDVYAQSQTQTADGLETQPQDTVTPITPVHDMEDQPTQPVTSEYATEPHHTPDEMVTPEHNAENGTADVASPIQENPAVETPTDHIEAQSTEPTTSEYGTLESQTAEPTTTASTYETAEDQAAQSTTTAPAYGTLEDQTTEPPPTASAHETVEAQTAEPAAEYGTPEDHVDQPTTASSEPEVVGEQTTEPVTAENATTAAPEYGTVEDHLAQPAVTDAAHETVGEETAEPTATTTEYATAGEQAAPVVTPEDRTENQMAEPTSVAPEHEIAEGAPQADVVESTVQDPVASPTLSEPIAEESLASQNGSVASDLAEQPAQPDATLPTHEAAEQQAVLDSTYTPEPETAVTQEQPILDTTTAPASTVAPETTATQEQPTLDTTTAPASTTAPESVAQAQSSAPVVDYASKLQALQQQLQASQQQLQEVKARLQDAKQHESQIQATREQLKSIQDELAATQAELNETHSRIDQY